MEGVGAAWKKFFDPTSLRRNLVAAAVFLATYEMLKDSLIDHLRGFFCQKWTAETGWEVSERYREKVLSLEKKEMAACARWFQLAGALEEEGLVALKAIAEHRNLIAHELPAILGSSDKDVSLSHLRGIYLITSKIDRWWLREVEIPTNPDFGDDPPSEEDIEASFSEPIRDFVCGAYAG